MRSQTLAASILCTLLLTSCPLKEDETTAPAPDPATPATIVTVDQPTPSVATGPAILPLPLPPPPQDELDQSSTESLPADPQPTATATPTAPMTSEAPADETSPLPGAAGTITSTPQTTTIALSWQAASDTGTASSALSYRVYRSTTANLANVAAIEANGTPLGAWTTAVTDSAASGLSPATAYTFNVLVRDLDGNVAAYTQTTVSTSADSSAPIPGGALAFTSVGTTGMTVTWPAAADDASAANALQYRLFRSLSANLTSVAAIEQNGTPIDLFAAGVTTKVVGGLSFGTTYHFAVIVMDEAGNKGAYAAAAQKSAPLPRTKLSQALVSGGNTTSSLFQLSPDNSKIVYTADAETDATNEAYVVNIDGTGRAKLNDTMVTGGNITAAVFTPDSSKIVFYGDQEVDGKSELYAVSSDGTGRFKLNGTMVANGGIITQSVSPDSTKIAYIADQDTDGVNEVYLSNLDGSNVNNQKISGTAIAAADAVALRWSNDSQYIVFSMDRDIDAVVELFSVKRDGTGLTKVHPDLPSGRRVEGNFVLSPDGAKVAYISDEVSDNVMELFVAATDGSGRVKVSTPMTTNGDLLVSTNSIRFSNDGSRVIYIADATTDGRYELFSVLLDGTSHASLSGTFVSGGSTLDMCVTRSGNKVIYLADQDTDNVYEVFAANVAGGAAPVKLSGAIASGGEVKNFIADGLCKMSSLNQNRFAFLADRATDEVFEFWAVDLDGQNLAKVSGSMVSGGDGYYGAAHAVSDRGDRLVYIADQDANDQNELYAVDLGNGGNAIKLNQEPIALGSVSSFKISADSRFVVYSGVLENAATVELWAVGIDP